jgi:hypothetical protein
MPLIYSLPLTLHHVIHLVIGGFNDWEVEKPPIKQTAKSTIKKQTV